MLWCCDYTYCVTRKLTSTNIGAEKLMLFRICEGKINKEQWNQDVAKPIGSFVVKPQHKSFLSGDLHCVCMNFKQQNKDLPQLHGRHRFASPISLYTISHLVYSNNREQ